MVKTAAKRKEANCMEGMRMAFDGKEGITTIPSMPVLRPTFLIEIASTGAD